MSKNNQNQLILSPRWLIPVVPEGVVLTEHSLVVLGDKIQDLLPRQEALSQYPDYEETELPHHALTPGFINVHGHSAMTLLRGYADDKALMDWLNNYIWPIENQFSSNEFVYDGTALAIAEMIRGGTTCAIDSYFFPNASADAYTDLGFRAQVSMPIIQFPTNWAKSEEEHLHKALEVHNDIKSRPLIKTALAPHAPYTVTDQGFEKIVMYAAELDVPIHLHLHETATEVEDAVRDTGKRPIARMHELGVISPALQAVHMTQLTEDEIKLLTENNVNVAHCPDSNLKLASGYCPVPELIAAGVNVAVGTDGVASNNNLDMSAELRSAALLAKGLTGIATNVTAEQALAMGTINGARLMGREAELGSLEIGKLADVIAIDLSDPLSQPVYHPISQIVYSTSGEQISHVWISGKAKLTNRQFTDIDIQRVVAKAREWREKIQP
jgi:5-methylthioadenosine/S-adenosylhomocysteine deaminase